MTKFVLLAGASLAASAYGLTCYQCTANLNANGAYLNSATVSCWNPTSTAPSGVTGGVATTAYATKNNDGVSNCLRCTAEIDLVDGWPVSITRSCESTAAATGVKYGTATCEVSNGQTLNDQLQVFGSDDSNSSKDIQGELNCESDCDSADRCNSQYQLSDLTVCPQQDDYTGKWCDFSTGTWQCQDGLTPAGGSAGTPTSAQQCTAPTPSTTTTFHKCIQCNSMTDSNCWTKTASTDATDCNESNATQDRCFSTTTVIYDQLTGGILRENIVKGCASTAQVTVNTDNNDDQCYWSFGGMAKNTVDGVSNSDNTWYDEKQTFTANYHQYHELICTKACDSDSCNTFNPNGSLFADNYKPLVYCAQYDSTTDGYKADNDFSASVKACPSGTIGCWSSVSYLHRETNPYMRQTTTDKRDVILVQNRGCLAETHTYKNECVEDSAFSSSTSTKVAHESGFVKKMTCTGYCESDSCNKMGWPNRPKCLQVAAGGAPLTGMVGTACPSPSDDMCYIKEHNFVTPSSHYTRNEHIGLYQSSGTDLGFFTTVERGCAVKADGLVTTGCTKQGERGSRELANHFFESCNYTCSEDNCNWGSAWSSSIVNLASPVLIAVAMLFKNL